MRCPNCDGKTDKVDNITMEMEGYVFVIKGDRCRSCGEEFSLEEESQRVIQVARKLGIWPEPMKLHRKLSKSGGGLVLRIPADLERQLGLDEKKEVKISKLGSRIVIET